MIEELSITSILRRQQSCSFLNAALRAALVMDEEERKEHEVGDWKGDPRYHIDRFSHSDRMRWLFLSYLSCTSIGSRVCAGIWATIGTSNDLVRSRSTTSWRSTLSLLFTLRQGLRRRKLGDGILAGTIDDVVHRSFAANVIHTDKLKKARVNEAHTDAIPNVHGGQI